LARGTTDKDVDITRPASRELEHLGRGHVKHTPMHDHLFANMATPPQRLATVAVHLHRNSGLEARGFEAIVEATSTGKQANGDRACLGHIVGI
jgi:hypothetical protein